MGRPFLTALYHSHPHHRRVDIIRVVAARTSPLQQLVVGIEPVTLNSRVQVVKSFRIIRLFNISPYHCNVNVRIYDISMSYSV